MSGRGRVHRQAFDNGRRAYSDISEGPYGRGPLPRPPHPARLEEELEIRHNELRGLAVDNRRLLEDRLALQQQLVAAKEELNRLHFAFTDVRAEKEAHVNELVQKGMKLEADLRAIEPLRKDVMQLNADVQKLNAMKEELSSEVQSLTRELTRAKSENQQIHVLRNEIEGLHQELLQVRNAYEYEKKGNAELVDQRQVLEKNLVTMAREMEKYRANLANTMSIDGRPWGTGGAYGTKLGSPDGAFPPVFGDKYGLRSGVADKTPAYGPGSGSWGAFENSRIARR